MRETHSREIVTDREGIPYQILFTKRNINKTPTIVGTIYKRHSYVAEAYGKNKKEVMKNIVDNIDITIYD